MSKPSGISKQYHEGTKYTEEGLRQKTDGLDWSKQPRSYKEYKGKERVYLGQFLTIQPNIFVEEGKTPQFTPPEVEAKLAPLSRLLYTANGITAFIPMADGSRHALRAAPSAGALYPTEIYVALRNIAGVAEGIYNYQVMSHSLAPHWEGDFWTELKLACYGHEVVDQCDAIVILTGVYYRSAWRYQERAYRRILLDTGHVLGNLASFAPRLGYAAFPISGFHDRAINDLLFLNDNEEGALMMVGLAQRDQVDMRKLRKSSVYASPAVKAAGSSMRDLHKGAYLGEEDVPGDGLAPDTGRLKTLHADKEEIVLPSTMTRWENKLEAVIIGRRSTRSFSGTPFNQDQLGSILKYAYQPVVDMDDTSQQAAKVIFDPSLIETYVMVLNVDALSKGIYYYDPFRNALRLLQTGDYTREAWHFCLGQELGRDASAIVVHASNLEKATAKYGERAYRYLHLDAGHIGQRLNLAAIALKLGASGIGGFFDDEVNDAVGLGREHIIVYITTLGTPGERIF